MKATYPVRQFLVGVFTLILGVCSFFLAQAQFSGTINTYARITAISPGVPLADQTTLTVDNVGGAGLTTAQFLTQGGLGHIFQMRGATVNTLSITSASHGAITALNNAGNNEQVGIVSVTATTIVVDRLLRRSYTVGDGLQIVHVPFSALATTTIIADITAPAWSSATSTGGVIMLVAQNTLEVGANISATGVGFAGGAPSPNALGGGPPCNNTDFAIDFPVTNQGAQKGEGIAPFVATADGGRGRWTNGGGGGNRNNAGGGGGSNYTAGATGGSGVFTDMDCSFPTFDGGRGRGGDALTYSDSRLFLGGGGGGGHQDNGLNIGTAGAAGGGIIILSAGTLTVTGNRTIAANGANAASTTGNEGAGAGGGGGVVVLEIGTYSLPASPGCVAGSLLVTANGGNGGNSNGGTTTRGGGGGGGVGYLAVTNTSFTGQCITFNSNPGTSGFSCAGAPASCPPGFIGSDPAGSLPPGCSASPCTTPIGPVVSPLPVTLVSFSAQHRRDHVLLNWATAAELNNSHFVLERSVGREGFSQLAIVPGQGTTSQLTSYQFSDRLLPHAATSLSYRLRQIDFDGTEHLYGPIRVSSEGDLPSLQLMQNPVSSGQPILVEVANAAGQRLELVDPNGRPLAFHLLSRPGTELIALRAHQLASGVYLVRLGTTGLSARVVVQ